VYLVGIMPLAPLRIYLGLIIVLQEALLVLWIPVPRPAVQQLQAALAAFLGLAEGQLGRAV